MFDNGPHVLVKSTFGLMSHSGLLYSVQYEYVAFGFCHIRNFVAGINKKNINIELPK